MNIRKILMTILGKKDNSKNSVIYNPHSGGHDSLFTPGTDFHNINYIQPKKKR